MKKIVLCVFIIHIFIPICGAQNKLNHLKQTAMEVTKDFERFDYDLFNSRSNKEESTYIKKLESGVYIYMSQSEAELVCKRTVPDSYFSYVKIYYPDGNISKKGLTYVNGFDKGMWYFFNESGQLTEEIDFDIPFAYTFENILVFCNKEGIPVEKGYITDGLHTSIQRGISGKLKKAEWEISWFKRPDKREIIKIDGVTGKIISRELIDFTNN
jgi:hypothetical protein